VTSAIMDNLSHSLNQLPEGASEAIVDNVFCSGLIASLGFDISETIPQFSTSAGSADYALRKNSDISDVFLTSKQNPEIVIELKGRDVNLAAGEKTHKSTINQLKKYLLSDQCRSAKWGIITNSLHIQLFRKHGKVVHAVTDSLSINEENIGQIVANIKSTIQKPRRALVVAVYNNKGGVGKTTSTVNLAALLATHGKRVLAIDFDPNQRDLSQSLGMKLTQDDFFQCLDAREKCIRPAIRTHRVPLKSGQAWEFDVVPVDDKLAYESEGAELRSLLRISTLAETIDSVRDDYDYILIDAPPNWRGFSQNAIYAADVVLIPTKPNSISSLRNAAIAIKDFIPQIQQARADAGPVALPIFFNGEKISATQMQAAQNALGKIVKEFHPQINLQPYFFPRATNTNKNLTIFTLPAYASIANAAFANIPAVYANKVAKEYYLELAKEYFLQ
jgi:cellulose biosynthesis protein BcsQ